MRGWQQAFAWNLAWAIFVCAMFSCAMFVSLGLAGGAHASGQAADRDCILAAQRAFSGSWVTSVQRRRPGDPLEIHHHVRWDRNEWRGPDTLVRRQFDQAGATQPVRIISETLNANGLVLDMTGPRGRERRDMPVTFGCRFDRALQTHHLEMRYQSYFGEDLFDFVTYVEISAGAFLVRRFARFPDDQGPYFWESSEAAHRP